MDKFIRKSGFTLIELVVVIAITAILSGIGVPRYVSLAENAKQQIDITNLRVLNSTTQFYAITSNISDGDIFTGINSDMDRQQKLVESDWLQASIEPEKKDADFVWHIDSQKWLYSIYAVSLNQYNKYLFANMSTEGFIFNSWGGGGGTSWSINEQGLYVTGKGNNDLLFIGNNKNEYTVTTKFRMDENPGANGGFGLFFETVLNEDKDNRDTGYILQFDRGFSEIVIRKRVEGKESNSSDMLLARIGDRSTSTVINKSIPYKNDSKWWESEKELSLTVKESGTDGIKNITVSLDGVVLLKDFQIKSSVETPNNHLGFRAWNNSPATVYEMIVE